MYKRRFPPSGLWQGSPFQRGNLKYVILDLIKDKPRYGYEIIRALEDLSQGMYTPSAGAIYPTLQMFEEMGYITVTQSEGKRVYTITEEGRHFLIEKSKLAEEVKERLRDHWDSAPVGARREVMNQMREIWQLLGQGFDNISPAKRQRIHKILEKTYSEIRIML
jgi:DNA-binding PadR family transcriptional regulator